MDIASQFAELTIQPRAMTAADIAIAKLLDGPIIDIDAEAVEIVRNMRRMDEARRAEREQHLQAINGLFAQSSNEVIVSPADYTHFEALDQAQKGTITVDIKSFVIAKQAHEAIKALWGLNCSLTDILILRGCLEQVPYQFHPSIHERTIRYAAMTLDPARKSFEGIEQATTNIRAVLRIIYDHATAVTLLKNIGEYQAARHTTYTARAALDYHGWNGDAEQGVEGLDSVESIGRISRLVEYAWGVLDWTWRSLAGIFRRS